MAPEMNYGLNNDDLGKDRRADARADARADSRPGYGGTGPRKPARSGFRFLGVPLGWWTAGAMLLAVVGLAFYGYYTVFNQGNFANSNNDPMTEAVPGAATGVADANIANGAGNTAVPLGDNNMISGENLNREVMNNLTNDKNYVAGHEKLQPPPESQNLPPSMTDKSLVIKSEPPAKSVPLPPTVKSPGKDLGKDLAVANSSTGDAAASNSLSEPAKTEPNNAPTQAKSKPVAQNNAANSGAVISGFSSKNWAIQLLAAHKPDAIKSTWKKLQTQYDVLAPLSMRIEQVNHGENDVVYRLQAGPFTTRQMAESTCEKLSSEGQSCLVVKPH